ncbi:MAG: hypothetical protein KDK23_06320 [Leptospiraceae bacterium]|nr:hypothetical protein [Leptospiraceae bacterium]
MKEPESIQRKTVIFLGDSFTEGYGLAAEHSFPSRIRARLAGREGWCIVNGGRSGDTVMDAYYRLDGLLKAHPRPDYLVIFLGANDIFRGVGVHFSYRYFGEIIDRARNVYPGIQIFVARIPSFSMEKSRPGDFESIFPRLESEYKVVLLPFFLEGVLFRPELCLPDGVHPNAEGMQKVADNVWDFLFVPHLLG